MTFLLAGYMFLFIYRPFEIYPVLAALHVERVWAILTVVAYVLSGRGMKRIAGLRYVLGFFLVVAASGLVTVSDAAWEFQVEELMKVMVFYFMLALAIDGEKEFRNILLAYVLIVMFYELKSLQEYFFFGRYEWRQGIHRLIGVDVTGSDSNTMAASIIYTLPTAWALFVTEPDMAGSRWRKAVLLAFCAVSAVCVVMTGSRGGMITLLLLVPLVALRSERKFKVLAFLIAAVAVAWVLMPQEKKIRFLSAFDPDAMLADPVMEHFAGTARGSVEGRTIGLSDGYALLKTSPVLGHGAGSFSEARKSVGSGGGFAAHNLYGQVMGELGILGILSFGALLGFLIAGNWILTRGDDPFLAHVAWACLFTIALLLLNGWGAHNLYRYNWLWVSAFTAVNHRLAVPDDVRT